MLRLNHSSAASSTPGCTGPQVFFEEFTHPQRPSLKGLPKKRLTIDIAPDYDFHSADPPHPEHPAPSNPSPRTVTLLNSLTAQCAAQAKEAEQWKTRCLQAEKEKADL